MSYTCLMVGEHIFWNVNKLILGKFYFQGQKPNYEGVDKKDPIQIKDYIGLVNDLFLSF